MSAFHLKGKGWYADGYSNTAVGTEKTSGTNAKNGNKTAGSKPEESSKTKTEQIAADKKESKAPANVSKASAGV